MNRILLIEDEPHLRKRLANVLATNGYEVIEAENGKAAIDFLQSEETPALILLDMVMPSMNGWGFLDFQRNDPSFSQIPVVILSAYEEMARSANPHAFLPKPIESEDLLRTVAQFC